MIAVLACLDWRVALAIFFGVSIVGSGVLIGAGFFWAGRDLPKIHRRGIYPPPPGPIPPPPARSKEAA